APPADPGDVSDQVPHQLRRGGDHLLSDHSQTGQDVGGRQLVHVFLVSAWPVSSRRTEIRQSPRSRTLVSTPCSAGWSASRPLMTVSSPWPLIWRPSNQAAHRPSRTPATRISYRAGPPEALTPPSASARAERRSVPCP